MKGRLIIAIISTTLEEAALAVGVLWGLPKLGIHIPLWVLIPVMLAWCTYTIGTYRMGSRALKRKPMHGRKAMIGSEGEVITSLAPEGMVRVKGELWQARATEKMETGEKIIVMRQDGLKLIVCRRGSNNS